MKKFLAVCLSMVIFCTACSAAGGTSAGSGTDSTGGNTAESSAEIAAEKTEENGEAEDAKSAGPNEEKGDEKPDLVLMSEGSNDYSRAAENKRFADLDPQTSELHALSGTTKVMEKDYTVMVYIVGSNLESRYGAASNDLDEMVASNLDYSKNNLIVYTGGSKRWNVKVPNNCNSVLNMEHGKDIQITAQTRETADMGTPETLSEFINYCTANYPAKHYGLVLWNHGAGPLWGYGSDELFGNDSLLLDELRNAMDKTQFGQDRKLDWVGFDACLMGTLENAALWENYADYLVGSEELEPGRGWNYRFLSTLNETSDARKIVTSIVDAYGSYYEENKSEFFNPDATLAAMDLSKTKDVVASADRLFTAMQDGIENGDYAQLNQARSKAKAFGISVTGSRDGAYDLLDLGSFSENVSEFYPEESKAVQDALDQMIVNSTANVSGAGGVSIYLPGDNQELYGVASELYSEEEMLSESYQEFVASYTDAWFAGSNTDWKLAELKENGDELTLELTPDQAKNASAFTYTVLQRNSMGDYAIATGRISIEPDQNNVLHIPADPMLLSAVTDMEEPAAPLTCVQMEHQGTESTYMTVGSYLTSGHEFKDIDVNTDESISVTAKNTDGETETTILDITSAEGSALAGGKESVDVSYFESFINAGSISLSPVRDEDGNLLPFNEWKSTGYEMYPMCLDRSFKLIMKHASEFEHDFICQVVIKDVNGNEHASEYKELSTRQEKETIEIPVDQGTLYAEISGDEASIVSYDGEDTEIRIPDSADGHPVTKIGAGAFYRNKTIVSVTLPDSVREIGDEAFSGLQQLEKAVLPEGLKKIGLSAFHRTGLTEITIPESVEMIGRGAFMHTNLTSVKLPDGLVSIGSIPFAVCEQLKEISISADNPNYKTVDGVLYSKDGKLLIQYPCAKGEEYAVEEGTEEIGYAAFASSSLKKVTFPETVRKIDNMGFFECFGLEALQLPDSLEEIGDCAFGELYLSAFGVQKVKMDSVHIGSNVVHIGTQAFDGLDIAAFDVDENNEKFASPGGFITNRSGDLIVTIPYGMGSIVVVPEGVTTLQDYQFFDLDKGTEFVIPDSVFRFGKMVFPGEYDYSEKDENGRDKFVYRTRLHCSDGSAAQKYADLYEIERDDITDPADLYYEEVVEETESSSDQKAVTTLWRVYANRAELMKIVTEDEGAFDVPAVFRDLPVTAIRYTGDSDVTGFCSVSKITIPESVEKIEPKMMSDGMYSLREVEVAEENDSYTSQNGVLYTKDMKELVYYPRRMSISEYAVPEGVETIGEYAAYMTGALQKVTLPSSVKTIGDWAFGSCSQLTDVQFGNGLQSIGNRAFYHTPLANVKLPSSVIKIGNSAFTPGPDFGTIELPDKLQTLGYCPFRADYNQTFEQDTITIPKGLQIRQKMTERVILQNYAVDGKNPYHTASDGLLMSKDGTTLVSVPTGRSGEMYVPDGTLYIDYSAFDECTSITDIYLPDSVMSIGSIGAKNYDTGEYYYTIHCHEGSEAAKKLDAKRIPWVAIE